MITIQQSIYSALSSATALTSKIASVDGIPAIYNEWAERKESPYIILTFNSASEEYYHQNTGILQVDIFDRRADDMASTVDILGVRNEVVKVLDGFKDLFGAENLRVFYNSEQPVRDDGGRYRRHSIQFETRYNRSFDV